MRRAGILADEWFQDIPSCASSDLIGMSLTEVFQIVEKKLCY